MNNRYEIAREFADVIRSDDIILFGSVARDDDTEESDIDILIITTNSDELSDEINGAAVELSLKRMNSYPCKETYEFLNGGMADRNKSSYDYSVVFNEEQPKNTFVKQNDLLMKLKHYYNIISTFCIFK